MKKYFPGVLVVCAYVTVTMAQMVQFGITGGYGLGTGLRLVGQVRNSTADTSWEDIYGGLGNGAKIGVDLDFFFDENIGLMISGGYSFLGGYSLKNTWEVSPGVEQSQENRFSGGFIPVNAGIKIRKDFGGIIPYIFIAPGAYFPMMNEKLILSDDSTGFDATYKFSTGFGFSSGIGVLLAIGGNSHLKLEVSPTYAFANVTERTRETDGVKTTTIYKNNTAKFPANSSPNTTYVHGQPRYSLSSVSFKAGLCFGM
jgi:hypothetical protein